ncbi:MAG TPA: hypothetical protein VKE93_14790 [Candidatus Angelobacter sp.]|nr:hypothetical protein [Candidatus Angelobacter sp.]
MSRMWKKAAGYGAMIALLALVSCKQSTREGRMEKPIPVSTPAPQKGPESPSPQLAPPTEAEVASALHRVFGDDLLLEQAQGTVFITGDFNGDDAQDLAMIVHPAPGKLADINGELANWIIQDADVYFIAPPTNQHVVSVPVIPAAKVKEGEVLLAIIHGYGGQGWRDPQARQGYLVKNAAATLLRLGPSIGEKAIRQMHLPQRTEIIYEQRNKKKGFLFWTGQAYAWHPSEG